MSGPHDVLAGASRDAAQATRENDAFRATDAAEPSDRTPAADAIAATDVTRALRTPRTTDPIPPGDAVRTSDATRAGDTVPPGEPTPPGEATQTNNATQPLRATASPPEDVSAGGQGAAVLPDLPAGRPSMIERILELARWAPSGDNSQPWRFEVVSQEQVRVHAFDTRRHCVYDLAGEASQLAVGALLETMRIAASAEGRTMRAVRRLDAPNEFPVIDVWFQADPATIVDPLLASVRERSVQRKPLSTRALRAAEKDALEAAVGPDFDVVWFEGWRRRMQLAWLAVRSAKVRLTIPEAYAVHREIIAWDCRYSEDRVPDQALGADRLSVLSMRWAMANWGRVQRMNRWFGGTYAPRLQLDLIPGLRCAAHFAIVAREAPKGIDDFMAAGGAVQRFWLTAAGLGLQLQPQYTPLVFAAYSRRAMDFTTVTAARERADEVAGRLEHLLGRARAEAVVFLGRIGEGPTASARSVRLPLERLRWDGPESLPGARRDDRSEAVHARGRSE